MSSVTGVSLPIEQIFVPKAGVIETESIRALVKALSLEPHIEGGFFSETDRAPQKVPSPFPVKQSNTHAMAPQRPGFNAAVRNASTTIHYLLTPNGPQGGFHRNAARTMHLHHSGRGRYVIIHADEDDQPGGGKRVETYVVGSDVTKGEKLQWMVEGGKYKASYLLPDQDGQKTSGGLLISEVVVPGFEYCDHDFLTEEELRQLVTAKQFEELKWLLRS